MSEQQELAAGAFSEWLSATRKALSDNSGTEVPCGDCTACCRSSYFIHIQPDERETIAQIPPELLFPAPGLPEGNLLMGYDEQGYCPMLQNGACSIYGNRPKTCRSYDCRIFPATGTQLSGKDKTLIIQQVERWKFSTTRPEEIQQLQAVKQAAAFLKNKARLFGPGQLPSNPTQLAIMALKVYDIFLPGRDPALDDKQIARAIVQARDRFDAQMDVA